MKLVASRSRWGVVSEPPMTNGARVRLVMKRGYKSGRRYNLPYLSRAMATGVVVGSADFFQASASENST